MLIGDLLHESYIVNGQCMKEYNDFKKPWVPWQVCMTTIEKCNILPDGFEPPSSEPKSDMIDLYTTGVKQV